ncbi:MAG: hypothetical protein IJ109_01785 [Firmicutes bacterium]|nr:hypothetical protein [Bacillota bacterium]
MKKRSIYIIMLMAIMLMAIGAMPAFAEAEENPECISLTGSNVGAQDYSVYGKCVYSYLIKEGDGYMRVQGNAKEGITAVYYDKQFNTVARKSIPQELPLFGGFHSDGNAYYIVSGQNNVNESDSVEVYRVTKYDTDWNRIGSCSLNGANTYHPFDAGSCRMASSSGKLIIRTCHEMYKSDDGYHHQANVSILVNTNQMNIEESATEVEYSRFGYASHSFNQFVMINDGKIVGVDHGDAYPRAIMLNQCNLTGSSGIGSYSIFKFAGNKENNYTGASVGALEAGSSCYLVAGNSVVQDDTYNKQNTRNVFVTAVDKSTGNIVGTNWLTSISEGEGTTTTPHMVKISADRFLVLWNEDKTVRYTFVDGNGKKTSEIYSLEGKLSDCAPILCDGNIVWYTWNNRKETFYQVPVNDPGNPIIKEAKKGHEYELDDVSNGLATVTCSKCNEQTTGKVPTSFSVWWTKPTNSSFASYSSAIPSGMEAGAVVKYSIDSIRYSADSDLELSEFTVESSDPENCVIDEDTQMVTFLKAGTYKITVYPKFNPTNTKICAVTIVKELESVSLKATPEKVSPGETVRLDAVPEGGKGSLTYVFLQLNSDGTESVVREGSTMYWYRVTLNDPGEYVYRVDVTDKNDGNRVVSSNTVKIHVHDYQLAGVEDGTATLRCEACGEEITAAVPTNFTIAWRDKKSENSGYRYQPPAGLEAGDVAQYWVYSITPSSVESRYRDITIEPVDPESCTVDKTGREITFHRAGDIELLIYPTYNPEVKQTFTFRIVKPLESVALTADPETSQQFGGTVKLTAAAEGGKGTLTYRFIGIDPEGTETDLRAAQYTDNYTWSPAKAGAYSLKVEVTDPGDNNNTVTSELLKYEVTPAEPQIKGGKEITAAGELIYGQKLEELKVNNAVFVGIDGRTELQGTFALEDPERILDAGTHAVKWSFHPNSSNYAPVEGSLEVTVQKAVPAVEAAPEAPAFAYHPVVTLGERELAGGKASVEGTWAWADPQTVPEVPGGNFQCVFQPLDDRNYSSVTAETAVTVTKAVPMIGDISASEITYGQSLAASKLEGAAQYSEVDKTEVAGSFRWTDKTQEPSVSDSGKTEYEAEFIPADRANYEAVKVGVTLTVAKAEHPPVMPSGEYSVPNKTDQLTDEILAGSEGWVFAKEDLGTQLPVGEAMTFTAVYIGEDAENYETLSAPVQVTRSECDHEKTELRDVKEATCQEEGYTGDTWCLDCGEKIALGQAIPIDEVNGHSWNAGEVTKEATTEEEGEKTYTCTRCGAKRTEVIEKLPAVDTPGGETPQPGDRTQAKGEDGTAFGPGAALEAAEQAIGQMKSDADPAGTVFGLLQARSSKQTKTSVTVTWKKVSGAKSYVIYGNQCGTSNKLQKQKVVSGTSAKFTRLTGNNHKTVKVKKGKYYKFLIIAVDRNNNVITTSKVIHAATKGGKVGNPKSVKTKAKKNKVTVKMKKSFKLAGKQVPQSKKLKVRKHRAVSYESSNPKIAAVSKKGVIKGIAKGTCYVYAYAQNGAAAKIKVTVK